MKLKIRSEYLLIQQLFIQNKIFHNKREQCLTFPHSQSEGLGICHMLLLVNVRVQHRILDYANGTPLRQLLALPQHFEISDRQDASSEGRKDVSHLVPSTADVQDTPIKTPTTRLLPVGLCGALAPRAFHLLGPLKKYVVGHRCQADTEVQQAASQCFRLQRPEFRSEGVRLLVTHCDKWLNIQDDYVEM